MFIEKRKIGESIKYYLVHSYREGSEVKKVRRYLGLNLSNKKLETAKQKAEQEIKKELEQLNTEVFNFTLSKKQIEKLNKYDIKIHHFDKKDWKRFTADFVYNTNAIEGSTVELSEVEGILHRKPHNDEEIETKGVAKAVEFIKSTKQDFSVALIKKLHKLCFKGSKPFAGEFRNVGVVIRNIKGEVIHSGIPVSELNSSLKELVGWYKKNKKRFKPLVLAAIIHNQFEHIHPFQDGNGRVGRLLLNFVLINNKYPPVNISLEDRSEYYNTLQEYSKKHSLGPTMVFLVKQYKKTLR